MNPMGDNEVEASTAPAARVVDDLPIGALHPSIPKAVREATYLSTRNAERYRVITHFFYERIQAPTAPPQASAGLAVRA